MIFAAVGERSSANSGFHGRAVDQSHMAALGNFFALLS